MAVSLVEKSDSDLAVMTVDDWVAWKVYYLVAQLAASMGFLMAVLTALHLVDSLAEKKVARTVGGSVDLMADLMVALKDATKVGQLVDQLAASMVVQWDVVMAGELAAWMDAKTVVRMVGQSVDSLAD